MSTGVPKIQDKRKAIKFIDDLIKWTNDNFITTTKLSKLLKINTRVVQAWIRGESYPNEHNQKRLQRLMKRSYA